MEMKIIDSDATTWYTNLGAFRLPHPFREGVNFEPAVKYMVHVDDWMKLQPTLVETTVAEDLSEVQLHPKQPGSPQFDKAEDDAAAAAAVAALVASRNPELTKQQKKEDKAALAASQTELAEREKQIAAEVAKQTGTA